MKNQNTFKRYEIKYLITKEEQAMIEEVMAQYMCADEHGKSTICNIYFDTPTSLLIRRSIEKPIYKEKLRVRSYGVASPESTVFVEIKKKFDSVVYKRRVSMSENQASNYLSNADPLTDRSQIINEIDYFKKVYDGLIPKVFLSYERKAFYGKTNHDFRITFDENILWRDYNLSLREGAYGQPQLKENEVLMEIKTTYSLPLWLAHLLSANHIEKTSFSKYGNAYLSSQITKGVLTYA